MARDALLTMTLILVSRLLGFVRERAVAEVFGRNAETDAFTAAFNIPDLMYFLLVGGAITAAFIPVFTGYLARGEERRGWRVASTFLNGTASLLVLITVGGMAFSRPLAPLVAYGFSGEQRALLVDLMRWMFPAVFFTALAGLGMGVLNSYRTFTVPLLGPIVYNSAIIAGAYGLGPVMGIRGMAVGTVAGAMANAAIQWGMVTSRYRGWRPVLDFQDPGVRTLYRLMLPALFGLSVTQLSLMISTNLASTLPEGSITALKLANRVMQFPLGIFGMGVSMVAFPTMAAQVALGHMEQFGSTLSAAMRGVLYFTIPSAVGLAVLAEPVIRFLFEAGQFTQHDSRATAVALVFYAGALVSQSAIQILTRAFYSMQDTKTPVVVSVVALTVNTALSLLFLRVTRMGHAGLALSFTLTSLANWALYVVLLARRGARFRGGELARFFARVSLACAPLAWASWAAAGWTSQHVGTASLLARAIVALAGVGAGALAFGVTSWALGLEESRRISGALQRTGRRLGRAGAAGWCRLRSLVARVAGAGGAGT